METGFGWDLDQFVLIRGYDKGKRQCIGQPTFEATA